MCKTILLLLMLCPLVGCAMFDNYFVSSNTESGWWKNNRQHAKFVPGEGYKVAGVEGYLDQTGHPINKPMKREELVQESEDGLIADLGATKTLEKIKASVGIGRNQEQAEKSFAEGEEFFAKQEYNAAITRYKMASANGVGSPVEADAMFKIAECQYMLDRYTEARDAYNGLVLKHPNTRHLNTLISRQWEIAQFWGELDKAKKGIGYTPNFSDKTQPLFDTIGQAIKTYDSIRINDPTGPRADDAVMAIAGIYFRQENYIDADYYYTLLRREYPRSDYQFEAHLLGFQSKLRVYRGPEYDGTPLEDAKDLLAQLKNQFGRQLSKAEASRLEVAEASLNKTTAERTLFMAKYYDNTEHYGAASIYYAELMRDFPESALAAQAKERLVAIRDKPAVPEERLAWLTSMLPENGKRSAITRVAEAAFNKTRLAVKKTAESITK